MSWPCETRRKLTRRMKDIKAAVAGREPDPDPEPRVSFVF